MGPSAQLRADANAPPALLKSPGNFFAPTLLFSTFRSSSFQGNLMKNPMIYKAAVALAAGLTLLSAQAANLSKGEYEAFKTRIEDQYKSEKAACSSQAGNAKDICVEAAKGKEKIARIELEYSYTGKASDRAKINDVKANAEYGVAKERCDDKAGNDHDVCMKEAEAAKTKVLTDSKMAREMQEVRADASEDKREADYKVAVERCDSMAGDAKTGCVAMAKRQFGKE
jgi:hypothetical protein